MKLHIRGEVTFWRVGLVADCRNSNSNLGAREELGQGLPGVPPAGQGVGQSLGSEPLCCVTLAGLSTSLDVSI